MRRGQGGGICLFVQLWDPRVLGGRASALTHLRTRSHNTPHTHSHKQRPVVHLLPAEGRLSTPQHRGSVAGWLAGWRPSEKAGCKSCLLDRALEVEVEAHQTEMGWEGVLGQRNCKYKGKEVSRCKLCPENTGNRK